MILTKRNLHLPFLFILVMLLCCNVGFSQNNDKHLDSLALIFDKVLSKESKEEILKIENIEDITSSWDMPDEFIEQLEKMNITDYEGPTHAYIRSLTDYEFKADISPIQDIVARYYYAHLAGKEYDPKKDLKKEEEEEIAYFIAAKKKMDSTLASFEVGDVVYYIPDLIIKMQIQNIDLNSNNVPQYALVSFKILEKNVAGADLKVQLLDGAKDIHKLFLDTKNEPLEVVWRPDFDIEKIKKLKKGDILVMEWKHFTKTKPVQKLNHLYFPSECFIAKKESEVLRFSRDFEDNIGVREKDNHKVITLKEDLTFDLDGNTYKVKVDKNNQIVSFYNSTLKRLFVPGDCREISEIIEVKDDWDNAIPPSVPPNWNK